MLLQVTDILLLADPVLHISQAIHSPRAYLALTDCLLKQIEVSTQPELQAARALILRIRQRKLYRLVEEAIIPTHLSDMPDVTEADILAYQHAAHTRDIVVQNLRIHYAMKVTHTRTHAHTHARNTAPLHAHSHSHAACSPLPAPPAAFCV